MAAALVLSPRVLSLFFSKDTFDPVTLIGVVVLFAGIALLAFWVPANQATKVDPIEALRYE